MQRVYLTFCFVAMLCASFVPAAWSSGTTSLISETSFGIDDCTTDLAKEGNIVLVGRAHDGAAIVDVSNPSAPVVLNTINPDPTTVNIVDVQLLDDKAYLFNYGSAEDTLLGNWVGLYIYDISTPIAPTLDGYILWGNGAWHHQAARNIHGCVRKIGTKTYAFCSTRITYAVEIFDVTNPASIQHVSQIWRSSVNEDVVVQDNKLYTAWTDEGFTIHDVSNPNAPTQLGFQQYVGAPTINGGFHTVWPTADGNHVVSTDYTQGSHVRVWDVSVPTAITQTGSWQLAGSALAYSVQVAGDFAYVGHLEDGIQVLDISDRFSPTLCAAYDPDSGTPTGSFKGMRDVVVENQRVYSTHLSRGLFIFDFNVTPVDTVTITKAIYKQRQGKLVVWATSSAQPTPTLTVTGIGTLKWKANKNRYQKTWRRSNPGTVTVTSTMGGSDTATVQLRN